MSQRLHGYTRDDRLTCFYGAYLLFADSGVVTDVVLKGMFAPGAMEMLWASELRFMVAEGQLPLSANYWAPPTSGERIGLLQGICSIQVRNFINEYCQALSAEGHFAGVIRTYHPGTNAIH